jgi:hypothetical protein
MIRDLLVNSTVTHAPVTVYPSEREVINSLFLGPYFPWFWQNQQTLNDASVIENDLPEALRPYVTFYNGPFLSHTLLHRTEVENVKHNERPATEISQYWEFFLEIFHRFMTENNIKYSNIFRANLNLTWHNGNNHTAPHLDHSWPHKNFIMYLTSCDNGQTIVWPDDFSTSYMIPCIEYTAVTFKQHWHAHRYPTPGARRLVFVVTYV